MKYFDQQIKDAANRQKQIASENKANRQAEEENKYWQEHTQWKSPEHRPAFLKWANNNYGGAYDFDYYITGVRNKKLKDPGTDKIFWTAKNQYDYGSGKYLYSSPNIDPYKADKAEVESMNSYLHDRRYEDFDPNEYRKYYNRKYYENQYTDTPNDVYNKENGLAPRSVQTLENTRQELLKYNDYMRRGKITQELDIQKEFPNIYQLNLDAKNHAYGEGMRMKEAAGNEEAAPGNPYAGTNGKDGLPPDLEQLMQWGYDEKTGFAGLFENRPLSELDAAEARDMPFLPQKAANIQWKEKYRGMTVEDYYKDIGIPLRPGQVRYEDGVLEENIRRQDALIKLQYDTGTNTEITDKSKLGFYMSPDRKQYVSNKVMGGNYVIRASQDPQWSGWVELFHEDKTGKDTGGMHEYYQTVEDALKGADNAAGGLLSSGKIGSEGNWSIFKLGESYQDKYLASKGIAPRGVHGNFVGDFVEGNVIGGISNAINSAFGGPTYLALGNIAQNAIASKPLFQGSSGNMTLADFEANTASLMGKKPILRGVEEDLNKVPVVGPLAVGILEGLASPGSFIGAGEIKNLIVNGSLTGGTLAYQKAMSAAGKMVDELVLKNNLTKTEQKALLALVEKKLTQNSDNNIPTTALSKASTLTDDAARLAGAADNVKVNPLGEAKPIREPVIKTANLGIAKYTRNAAGEPNPVAPKMALTAPNAKATAADPFVDGLSKGMGELDGVFFLTRPSPKSTVVLEATRNINKPYVAVAKNADNALLDARGFATPEAAQSWAKEAGDASVYRVAGRDAGGAVKALEPVKPQMELQPMPASGVHGDNMGNMLRWKPGEAIPEGKAAAVGETGGFVDGLDEGMGGLKDVKEDAPEGIDFSSEGGKVGAKGESYNEMALNLTNAQDTKNSIEVRNFSKELLKSKPKYSPTPNKWMRQGGRITIDENNVWTYRDWEGHSVSYPGGYPDFTSAGLVKDSVKIQRFRNYQVDFDSANRLATNGPITDKETWHHCQDMRTMQRMNRMMHNRFTHKGGMAKMSVIEE